jgi:hypothetical protein
VGERARLDSGCGFGGDCEGLLDGGGDAGVVGGHVGGEAGDDFAVAADEEFLEVPEKFGERIGWGEAVRGGVAGEVFAPRAGDDVLGGFGDEFSVEGVLVRAGDGDLGEEGEGDGVLGGAEGGDLGVGAGLLAGEVVGGEAADDEALGFVVLEEGFEGGVLRGKAAFAGDVDDEQDVSCVVGEGGGRTGEAGEGDFVERRHKSSLAWAEESERRAA